MRLEGACRRALGLGSPTRRSVLSILERGLDQVPLAEEETAEAGAGLGHHRNIRGPAYYASVGGEGAEVLIEDERELVH